jgi:hypothetical protein
MYDGFLVLAYAVFHMTLIALPGVAATLFAARRGLRDVPMLLAIGLAASGAAAMLAFWAYFGDHRLGLAVSFATPIVAAFVSCRCAIRLGRGFPWASIGLPVALWALGTIFVLSLGFLYGGTHDPLRLAEVRFAHQLPNDNTLPLHFGEWIYRFGHTRVPPRSGSWLSSDRPPLQMGYVVAAMPFGAWKDGLHYQVLSVALQQLWIIGMWALLEATDVRARTRALVMAATLVSDIAILHGFFVWPKLVPVGFLLAAAAIVFSPRWRTARTQQWLGSVVATLLTLALLCHGTSMYAVAALVIVAAVRGRPTWRWVGAGLIAAALLYMPWSAYQKYFDPPGNHLLKSQLAVHTPGDHRSVVATIVHAYSEIGFRGALDNRVHNIDAVTGRKALPQFWHDAVHYASRGDFYKLIDTTRGLRFLYLLPCLGLLLLAPLLMLIPAIRRRPRSPADWRFAQRCFVVATVAGALWILVQYGDGPAVTYIHVGSLAVPMLAIAACVAGLAAMSTRLATALVAVNVALVLLLYAPRVTKLPGATGVSPVLVVAGIAAVAAFVALAARAPGGATSPHAKSDEPAAAPEDAML